MAKREIKAVKTRKKPARMGQILAGFCLLKTVKVTSNQVVELNGSQFFYTLAIPFSGSTYVTALILSQLENN